MHARLSSRQAPSIPAISARGLTKSFARGLARAATRVTALHAVDLDVHRGEIVALVGSTGAGKTTLLQCLCGLLRTDSGEIHCSQRVSYVAPVPVFYPFLTPRDVLELSIASRGGFSPRPDVVSWTLSLLELDRVARTRLAALPCGGLKRIAVAEALILRPRVLLIDSRPDDSVPFDAVTLRALENCAANGAAIVLASRDESAAGSVATRLARLEKGRNMSNPGRFVAERIH